MIYCHSERWSFPKFSVTAGHKIEQIKRSSALFLRNLSEASDGKMKFSIYGSGSPEDIYFYYWR